MRAATSAASAPICGWTSRPRGAMRARAAISPTGCDATTNTRTRNEAEIDPLPLVRRQGAGGRGVLRLDLPEFEDHADLVLQRRRADAQGHGDDGRPRRSE